MKQNKIMSEDIKNNQFDNYLSEEELTFDDAVLNLMFSEFFNVDTHNRIKTEGYGDAGADYIFYTSNKIQFFELSDLKETNDSLINIYFVQLKNSKTIDSNVPNKFIELFQNIRKAIANKSISYPKHYNEQVKENIQLIKNIVVKYGLKNKIRLNFIYASRASKVRLENANDLIGRFETLKDSVEQSEAFSNVDYSIISIDDITELISKGTNFEHIFEDVELFAVDILNENIGILSLIPLKAFFDFVTDKDGLVNERLFESNIRDFKGKSNVNKDIAKTLEDEYKIDFWWLNNGITITAEEITYNNATKQICVKNPQIVNGLQTSYSLISYFNKFNPQDEIRKVFVKFLEFKEEIQDLELEVIIATNRQNEIRDKDIHANDMVQRTLEEFLYTKGMYYQRKDKYYTNRKVPKKKIVKLDEIAKYMNTIMFRDPSGTRNNPGKLTQGNKYEQLFSIADTSQDYERYYYAISIYNQVAVVNKGSIEINGEYFEKANFINHIVFITIIILTGKLNYTFEDIKKIDLTKIDVQTIEESYRVLIEIITSNGIPNSKILKNIKETSFNKKIIVNLENFILNT